MLRVTREASDRVVLLVLPVCQVSLAIKACRATLAPLERWGLKATPAEVARMAYLEHPAPVANVVNQASKAK